MGETKTILRLKDWTFRKNLWRERKSENIEYSWKINARTFRGNEKNLVKMSQEPIRVLSLSAMWEYYLSDV